MKKCMNCGRKATSSNEPVCEYCGGELTQLDGFTVSEQELQIEEYNSREVMKKRETSTVKNIVLAVLVGAFIGLLCIACFVLGQKSEDHNENAATVEEEKLSAESSASAEADEKPAPEPDEKPTFEIEGKPTHESKVEENSTVAPDGAETLTTEDIELIVKDIRAMYNEVESTQFTSVGTEEAPPDAKGVTTRYYSEGHVKKIEISPDDNLNYTRIYYVNDDKLYFAFVFNGKKENRFYFHNGELIRWIDEESVTYDVTDPCPSEFMDWESAILEESREKLS